MTKNERLLFVALVVSILGFSVFSTMPMKSGYRVPNRVVSEMKSVVGKELADLSVDNGDIDTQYYKHRKSSLMHSKMVNMLSTVLDMSEDDVEGALSNGIKPRELLADAGVSLYDLQEEFNFELVGNRGFVRFY